MKKILCLGAFLGTIISFLLYFYSFQTSINTDLFLSVTYESDAGWDMSSFTSGSQDPLTPTQAIDAKGTVLFQREVPESWKRYNVMRVTTSRAFIIFVDDVFVFSNHPTTLTEPGELPLMRKETKDSSWMVVFDPSWVGKTMKVVSINYENAPSSYIDFELSSNENFRRTHEATVNTSSLPGAMFGVLSLLLIGLFLFQIATVKKGYSLLLLALASLLQMLGYMSRLLENPLPFINSDITTALYFLFPLLYLQTKLTHTKKHFLILTVSVWSLYFITFFITFRFNIPLPIYFDKVENICFILLAIMLYYCLKEYRTNTFVRNFLNIMFVFGIFYILLFFISLVFDQRVNEYMIIIFKEAFRYYCRPLLLWIFTTMLFALFILAVWDLLQDRIESEKQVERMQTDRAMLHLQMQAATDQLQSLRSSQEQTVIYRHDMRHHFTLLYGFAMDGDLQKIKEYLATSKTKIEEMTPTFYCENETINLLISAFDAKAKSMGVTLGLTIHVPKTLPFEDTELCSLLSNALENAITACASLEDSLKNVNLYIEVKNNSLLISTENPYKGILEKEGNHIKSTSKGEGHGYGIKSMISIVEKHGGLHSIKVEDGVFSLRLVLPLKQ